jgi:hypothetical protein
MGSARREKRNRAARERTAGAAGLRTAPVGLAAAAAIIVVCLIPFFLWGNPYDAQAVRYWGFWGTAVIAVAALATVRPLAALRDLPSVSARILQRHRRRCSP